MNDEPLVSVGIPCYDRPEGLRRTLECITGQTYGNLEIIVSDNCSPDPEVERIGRHFSDKDPRIKYYRQDENIGPMFNFKFVLEKATGQYFMWAADDDLWDRNFINSIMSVLKNNINFSFGFCNFETIDVNGNVIFEYPSFSRFEGKNKLINSYKFILEPEIIGKACIIYSIFNMNLIKNVVSSGCIDDSYWGCDDSLVLGCFARGNFVCIDRYLIKKRIPIDLDAGVGIENKAMDYPYRHTVPISKFCGYIRNCILATKKTGCIPLIILLIPIKLIISFYGSLCFSFAYLLSSLKKHI